MQRLEVSGAVRPIYGSLGVKRLTLILLMWRIWRTSNNASRWQMGFNLVFKGLSLENVFKSINVFGLKYYNLKLLMMNNCLFETC